MEEDRQVTEEVVPSKRSGSVAGAVLVGITVAMTGVFALSIGVLFYIASQQEVAEVGEDTWLRVVMNERVTGAPVEGALTLEPDAAPLLAVEVAQEIRTASVDDRVRGLVLKIDQLPGGWASLQELRASLVAFREAGKPCISYAENYSMGSYYLASACDSVQMAPAGVGTVHGMMSTVTYYAGTLEMLDAEAEFEHVGDFKSGPEPYTRSEPSPEASSAMEHLLDGLYGNALADIAASRGMTVGGLEEVVDSAPMTGAELMEAGLVDHLSFEPDVHALSAPDDDEMADTKEDVNYTSIGVYVEARRNEARRAEKVVAVVHANGMIVSGRTDTSWFGGGGMLGDRDLKAWLKEVEKDERVGAVVLRVDSPGGSGLASDMMWRDLEELEVPVVASMGDYAASGGYYIASPAQWIVAQPSTITGSIGVFGGKVNMAGAYGKLGMTSHHYKRGEHSDLFSSDKSFSEEGRLVYRRFLEGFYERFLERVVEGRALAGRTTSRDEVHEVAQGRVWTGTQALENGLVDELGGLDVAVDKAVSLADMGSDWSVVHYPKQKTFLEVILEDLQNPGGADVMLALPGIEQRHVQALLGLERVLEDGGVAAWLPVSFTVE